MNGETAASANLVHNNGHLPRPRLVRTVLGPLLVGLAIGAFAGLLWSMITPPVVPLPDYAVVVSAAYVRERLPLNAVERLTSAGIRDVSATLSSIATEYRLQHPDRQRDASNLEQLADVLKQQSVASGSRTSEGIGWWVWLALVVLVAGLAAWVMSLLQHRPPRRTTRPLTLTDDDPTLRKAQLVGGMRSSLPPLEQPGAARPAAPSTRLEVAETIPPRVGRLSTIARHHEVVLQPFVCHFHTGEEPFEDIHPILRGEADSLIGSCGLTAAAKLSTGSPSRYYAFTAWAHDSLSGEPMSVVGLLSRWASGQQRMTLYDPALTRASLHRAEKGLTATMETMNMRVRIEVSDVGYGTARDVPANSYFTILAVKFAVTVKAS